MMTITQEKKIQKSAGKRIWCASSRGINHPQVAEPSAWLVTTLLSYYSTDNEVSDHIWRLWKLMGRFCKLPGFQRPLGSCYHPKVADLLDVVYNYGRKSCEVFRRINKAAGTIAVSLRGEWQSSESGRLYQETTTHISRTPGLVSQLSSAIHNGAAPSVEEIDVRWFVPNWSSVLAQTINLGEQVASQPWLPLARFFASGHPLEATEYCNRMQEWSYSRDDDDRCEEQFPWPILTDGQIVQATDWRQSRMFNNNRAHHDLSRDIRITDATYAIKWYRDGSLTEVTLWPGHNLGQVAELIAQGAPSPEPSKTRPDFDYIFKDVMVNVQGLAETERSNVREAVEILLKGAPTFLPSRYEREPLMLAVVTAERLLREQRLFFRTDYQGTRKSALTADNCRRLWLELLDKETSAKAVTQITSTLANLNTTIQECRGTTDPWQFGKTMYLEVFDGTFWDRLWFPSAPHRVTNPRNCMGDWNIRGSYIVVIPGRDHWRRGDGWNGNVLRVNEAAEWGITPSLNRDPLDFLLLATEKRQPGSIATIYVEDEPGHLSNRVNSVAGGIGHLMVVELSTAKLQHALAQGLPLSYVV